jgi:threonine dehydratase
VREPDRSDFEAARRTVAQHLSTTPVFLSPGLGQRVHLKIETLQPTGSFKVRGALAAVARIVASDSAARIVAGSAGNHGLGIALASKLLGADATIVIPKSASRAKRRALEHFDVELIDEGDNYDEAEAYAIALAERVGRFVSPYNDPDVIAGQGTIATEILEQVPMARQIIVPVGGGGLVSGIALGAVLDGEDSVHVYGVEASASPALSSCVAAGHTVTVEIGPTLADGLAGNVEPGSVTVGLAARYTKGIVAVSERAIREAVTYLATQHGLVVEPSGAVGVAALISGAIEPPAGSGAQAGDTVVVISGRNVEPELFADILRDAMMA